MNLCPTCGGKKKDHSAHAWKIHMEMYENYRAIQKKQAKRARKFGKKNV